MLKSKAVKGSFPYGRPDEDGVVRWIKDRTIYKLERLWNRYTVRISRSYAFAKHGWTSFDFDAGTVWPLLAFKFRRIYPVLVGGHSVQKDEDMNALLEAIEICDRLGSDNYDGKYYDLHDAKWGELESKHDRVASRDADGKPTSYYWDSWRANVTPENKEQERADLLMIYANTEKDKEVDLDRLAYIFKHYLPSFWD